MSVGTTTAIIIGGGLLAGGSIASAELQSSAAKSAADLQTTAATHAADVQGVSTQQALDFQKQQAAQDLASAQAASLGNYQQWAAKEGRMSSLGQSVGLAPFQIPAYVPIPNVNAAAASTPPGTPSGLLSPNTMSTLASMAQNLAPTAAPNGQPGVPPPSIQPLQFVQAPGTPATANPYVTSIGSVIRPPSV